MSARSRQLAAHVRRLPDDGLNDLLVDLPTNRFAALVEAALSDPGPTAKRSDSMAAESWDAKLEEIRGHVASVSR